MAQHGERPRNAWELEDLIGCWTLDEAEVDLLANKGVSPHKPETHIEMILKGERVGLMKL